MASAAVGDLTFEITSAAADTFDIENDGQLRTKGDLDFEERSSYSLQVTITDQFGGTASMVFTIQVLNRIEPHELATPTPEPTATPTATPIPPTATPTATPVPPTATPTPEPTEPPAPQPTATPTPEPEDDGGFPVWAIIIIVIAAVVVVGGGGFVLYRRQAG